MSLLAAVAGLALAAVAISAFLLVQQLRLLRQEAERFAVGTGLELRLTAREVGQVVDDLETLQRQLGGDRERLVHLGDELERAKKAFRIFSKYSILLTILRMLSGGGLSLQGVVAVRQLIKGGSNG